MLRQRGRRELIVVGQEKSVGSIKRPDGRKEGRDAEEAIIVHVQGGKGYI